VEVANMVSPAGAGGLREDGSVGAGGTAVLPSAIKLAARTYILDTALKQSGIEPDLNAGHSIGEWLAGFAAGWVDGEDAAALFQRQDPRVYEATHFPFLVVGCGYEQLVPFLRPLKDIHLSTDNCPQQVIVCGSEESIEKLIVLLRDKQIFHQLLPFRSGFHTPFLREKLERVLAGFKTIRFRKPRIPLWSATTLEEYPHTHDGISALTREHLVRPVRFRELTERLYREGVRAFIQVGSGGLLGFVDDTLKGKSYSAVAANVVSRTGMEQLRRVIAALFAEGKDVGVLPGAESVPGEQAAGRQGATTAGRRQMRGQGMAEERSRMGEQEMMEDAAVAQDVAGAGVSSRLVQLLMDNHREIEQIEAELVGLVRERSSRQAFAGVFTRQLAISLDTHPYLIDHSLMRQRPGWPCVKDMDPVIPMTMMLELFSEIAEEGAGGKSVRKMTNIEVMQWMGVAEPFRETVRGEWRSPGVLELNLEKYARAGMLFGNNEDPSATANVDIGASLGISITPAIIYQRHMFHEKAYRGIRWISKIAAKGITGLIQGSEAKGSLLDNAGQLFGLWLRLTLPSEKIAFPVRIREVIFYGDRRAQEGLFECTCQLTQLTDEYATGDFVVKKGASIWAIIRGWQSKRLEVDDRLWNVCLDPLESFLSEEIAPGVFLFHPVYRRVLSWDFIAKRYFGLDEREWLLSQPPDKRREWMIGQVAAKDAIRAFLRRSKGEVVYPIEFRIRWDDRGKFFFAEGERVRDIHLSLGYKDGISVAMAAGRPGSIAIKKKGEGKEMAGEKEMIEEKEVTEEKEMVEEKEVADQKLTYKNYIIGWTR